ncbi:O-methyltransferase [Flavimarina sp. Hel_I_48]|uniref:O-methyltransferase n=1 Tax=Flavimarina sp. Hel_I_48 TaxID=1392488 RepID=UPI0004DF50EB|nr:class I SAM-dependent methyltransferase [Flavimarina sp. Hel_I_48]
MSHALYSIKKYLEFLRKSTHLPRVHTPFVYLFLTKCLYDQQAHPAYSKLKTYRKSVITDNKLIEITDFGAGSRVFKDDLRKISELGKNAGATYKRMRLLYRVTAYFKPRHVLELGTSVGLATAAFGLAETGKITSVEGCEKIANVAKEKLLALKIPLLTLKNEQFSSFLDRKTEDFYDLVYFDGNHSQEATLHYFNALLPTVTSDTVLIFDDIYWSKGMTAAWEIIKEHPQVQLSIDCFWLGFVFFRKEEKKQHFKIRL